jgi:hypothetical protein
MKEALSGFNRAVLAHRGSLLLQGCLPWRGLHSTLPGVRLPLRACLLLWLAAAGCFQYRVRPPELAAATEPREVVVWNFAWGLVQQEVRPDNCQGNGTAEVTVSTHAGFQLLALVTLGLVAPATVQWTCAKDPTGGGGFDDF